jgi:hypothetical protein
MSVINTHTDLSATEVADISFAHLERLSDDRGIFEHALGTERREGHGYCTDDNARLLVVTSREPRTDVAKHLSHLALNFVLDALDPKGYCHNRMDRSGNWADRPRANDWWGRSIWGLGTAVSEHNDPSVREMALNGFECAVQQRSTAIRSMAFAAIGAAEVLRTFPDHAAAKALLTDALAMIPETPTGAWGWPEDRLAYANAAIPEALIVGGEVLQRDDHRTKGLILLTWLLDRETHPEGGHLSVTGAKGRGPADTAAQFDQQPIEVSTIADACWSAYRVTGNEKWTAGVAAAARWFNGRNDAGLVMYDAESGGGYDGLERAGVNLNQGAESTLAFLSTMQRASQVLRKDARS